MAVCRAVRREILDLLLDERWESRLPELLERPARQVINPLFSSLCSALPEVRWRGIVAFGMVAARLAEVRLEDARVIMRRLMWSLNDESGGIGWGAPEAMAESLAQSRRLAEEFCRVLISYIHEDPSGKDNFLELDQLRRGAVWGVARLAQAHPDLARPALPDLAERAREEDPTVRGLACLALGLLAANGPHDVPEACRAATSVEFFWNRRFITLSIDDIARNALKGAAI